MQSQSQRFLASGESSEKFVRNDMKKVSSSAGLVAPSHEVDCDKDADVKLVNEPKQDSFIENGIENGNAAQGACFTEVNEPEQDCPHGGDVPAQAASSTKEGREIPGQANINGSPLLLVEKLKKSLNDSHHPPEVYQQLCWILLEHCVTVPDKNRDVTKDHPSSDVEITSSEKVLANSTTLRPEQVPDNTTYVKRLEREIADLKVTLENQGKEIEALKSQKSQHECCRIRTESEVAPLRNDLVRLQRDFQRFKIEIQVLKENSMNAHARGMRQQGAIMELKRETETFAHALDHLNAKVTAYLSLVDIQSVE